VQSITASVAATNATTNLSLGTYTAQVSEQTQGAVFRFTGQATWQRTPAVAATGPSIIAELLVGGVVVATSTSVNDTSSSSGTTHGVLVTGFFTIKSTGAGGTLDAYVGTWINFAYGAGEVSTPANSSINTTVTNTIEVRLRFSSTAATNTLTVRQGFYERVK
jgi:hypothetical protein